MTTTGWYGVDLDGTIAQYDRWRGADHIGDPIKRMQHRVLDWLNAGRDVRIFTARVSHDEDGSGIGLIYLIYLLPKAWRRLVAWAETPERIARNLDA